MDDMIGRRETCEHLKKRLIETAINNTGVTASCDSIFGDTADNRIGTWINEVPSAQQWIPCSERMPEYDAPALLSTAWGKTEIGWWTQRGWMIVPASYREFKQDAVVAWMPLPIPYREK